MTGTINKDYTEHFTVSTQALLFSLVHWQVHLKNDLKTAASTVFDNLVLKTLGTGQRIMMLEDGLGHGVVGGSQLRVPVHLGNITDATEMADAFGVIKQAGSRTDR